ncbi:MAG: hypothetical protein WA159_12810 [Variovorax sp.]
MNSTAGSTATQPPLTERDVKALAWAVRRAGKTSAAFKPELACAERAIARLRSLAQAGASSARDLQAPPAAEQQLN